MSDTSEQQVRSEELIEHQLKYCSSILTRIRRNSNASPFLQPVDPIALGIPDYAEKIKHPMDISTIRKKLDSGAYKTPEEFHGDMLLMFNNCYAYNPPDIDVYKMGKNLQSVFEALYAEMPMEVVKKPKTVQQTPQRQQEKPRRASKGADTLSAEDYLLCSEALLELEKSKHKKYTWPFLQPVTEEDAPGYFGVITNPMDMSTIRKRLDSREYSSFQQFVEDLELIIANCYKFNGPESEVYKCCEEFEKTVRNLVGKQQKVPEPRIAELRKKINQLTAELRELESQQQQSSGKRIFNLSDREKIGRAIIGLSRAQTEKVAEIVQRHCAYEYIDNDEIELNMQTISDDVVAEISDYIQKVRKETEEVS